MTDHEHDDDWAAIDAVARDFVRRHQAALAVSDRSPRPARTHDEQYAALLVRIDAWDRQRRRRVVLRWAPRGWIGRAAVATLLVGGVSYAQPAVLATIATTVRATVQAWFRGTAVPPSAPVAPTPAASYVAPTPRAAGVERLHLEWEARLALADLDIYDVRVAHRAGRLQIDGRAASVAQQQAAHVGVGRQSPIDLFLLVRPEPADLRRVAVLHARLAALADLARRGAEGALPPPTRGTWARVVAAQYAGVRRELDAMQRAIRLPVVAESRCAPRSVPPRDWAAQIARALAEARAFKAQIEALPAPHDPSTIPAPVAQQIAARFVRTWEAMCH